ncbi:cytochrome P450 [Mytilinidion resinicola]|uniref:Cytochrome P450 n=1 Tax=Mytilinidion resinicola TaxID=574789 RepID=A0A6A6YB16_9PEZI|nr:cytochrome P450 [Mytilinidion resinicola]KAF2806011.1 cytochrome P450 [Mytilinidion resinicola]
MSLSDAVQRVGSELAPASAGLLAILGLLYFLYERLLPQPLPGIPYDPKSTRKLLGDGPDMVREVGATREIHVWLLKKVNKLQAPLCQIFVQPFSRPWVVLADSVEAQNLLTRRPEFDRSSFDKTGLSPLDGFHSRMTMGDSWKRTRAWLQDLLSPPFLNNTVSPAMYENSLQLVHFWETKARLANDRPFDVNDDLDHVALDGMLSFVFDRQFEHAALSPQMQAVAQLDPSRVEIGRHGEAKFPTAPFNKFTASLYGTVDAVNVVTASLWPKFAKWWVRQIPRYSTSIAVRRQVIREQVQGAIRRFEATGEAKTAIEHMLAREKKAAEKQGRKPDYENQVLMDEIGGQFIAGFHTSSSTLSWIFIHLTRSPDVQAKLRHALHTAYSAAHAERRPPSTAELTKGRVPYLDAVLDEVLRLHATLLSRQAITDTQLFGYRIPKGTTVFIMANGPGFHSPSLAAAAALRDASSAEPDSGWDETRDMFTFEPERWLRKKEDASTTTTTTEEDAGVEFNANAAPQAAFGMGLRGCWGRKLAYVELRMIVSLVVWHFDLLAVPPALAYPSATLSIIHRADECYVRLRRREDVRDS